MIRPCVEANFQDEATVVAIHESRLVNRDVITQASFPAFSILKLNGKAWQVVCNSYAIAERPAHKASLFVASLSCQKI